MGFAENKQQEFTKKIRSLADQPNMQPHELKDYFDSSPEELRQSHNGLCDALAAKTAAAALGFSRTAGVPADTVQAAVENVQQQLDAAVMGNIPSGSVTGDKLAQDVRDRLTAIESAAAAEASTRAGADQSEAETRANTDANLQSQINTLSAVKCEAYIGTYMGDDKESQFVHLGFTPKAVLVFNNNGQTCTGYIFFNHTTRKPYTYAGFRCIYYRFLERNGLRKYRLNLHSYRHTYATLLIAAGTSPKIVQLQLGHSSINTTLGIYTHQTPALCQKICTALSNAYDRMNG